MADKQNAPAKAKAAEKPVSVQIQEYIQNIRYSDRYSDDEFEYRHVTLPKPFLKLFPKQFFRQDESGKQDPTGTLRLLSEKEWRAIGITQSIGWEHYEVHAPEPHVLLFRRPKDYKPPTHQQLPLQQQQPEPQNAKQNRGVRRK